MEKGRRFFGEGRLFYEVARAACFAVYSSDVWEQRPEWPGDTFVSFLNLSRRPSGPIYDFQ